MQNEKKTEKHSIVGQVAEKELLEPRTELLQGKEEIKERMLSRNPRGEFFKKYFYLFMWLVALGLSGGRQDPWLWHVNS